jgi:hypothetical protein
MPDTAPVAVTLPGTVTSAVPPTPVKPGYKTTEFYGSWAAKILGVLLTSGLLADGSIAMRITGAAVFILAQLGYTWSRTAIKTAAMLVLIGWLAPAQMACGPTAKSVESAVGHAAVDCAETEARAQAVNVMTPVVQAVILGSTSSDGKLIDTAPIKSALGKLTRDTLYTEAWTILTCAAKTAFATLTRPAPVQPGAPAAAPFVVDPAAVAKAETDVMGTIAPGARFALALP